MIIGKHINRYYLKYSWLLLLGLAACGSKDGGKTQQPWWR